MRIQFIVWLIFLSSTISIAQKRRITGQIVDFDTKKPVSNAVITLVGSSLPAGLKQGGVIADEQGMFDVDKLQFGKLSLLFWGRIYYKGERDYPREDKYYDVGIINVRVSRKNREVHLGKIYTFSVSKSITEKEAVDLPCLQVNDRNCCYQLLTDPNRLYIDAGTKK